MSPVDLVIFQTKSCEMAVKSPLSKNGSRLITAGGVPLQAVELLAHLALADWELCRKQMLEIWGSDFQPKDSRTDPADNRFVMKCGYSHQLEAVLSKGPFPLGLQLYFTLEFGQATNLYNLCEEIVTRDHVEVPCLEYESLSASIAELAMANASPPPRLPYVPVCLLQSQTQGAVVSSRLLFEALQVAVNQSHFRRLDADDKLNPRPRLTIDRIELDRGVFEYKDFSYLKYIHELRREGVRCVTGCEVTLDEHVTNILQTLYATDATRSKGCGIEKQIMSASINDPGLVFSAMYASTSLRELRITVEYPPDDDPSDYLDEFWRWFALAVVNGRAPIRYLEVMAEQISESDIRALRQALASQELLHEAVEGGSALSPRLKPRMVDTSLYSGADEPSMDTVCQLEHVQHGVPVTHESGDWLRVLMPGLGPAWVHKDAAIESAEQNELVHGTGPSIEQLVLPDVTQDVSEDMLEFIGLIGRRVPWLEVMQTTFQRTLEGSKWFTRMFPLCQQLQDLRIRSVDFEDATTLVDCYASGVCRVKRLTLYDVGTSQQQGDAAEGEQILPVIVAALKDKQHAITQCLEELTCNSTIRQRVAPTHLLNSTLGMLQTNTNMVLLHLEFPKVRIKSRVRNAYLKDFASQNGKLLVKRRGPLAMKRKIAFLSVTAAREGAAQRLDAAVISCVFSFAAKCEKRRVVFHIGSILDE